MNPEAGTAEKYDLIARQIASLAEEDARRTPLLANASALIMDGMAGLNWAGFYIMDDEADAGRLVLGPFQGHLACVHIPAGRGVCGTAVAQDATQLVRDVHDFPGHIACDAASRSEVVVPLHAEGRIVGVLDIDSPLVGRFSPEDAEGFEHVARTIEKVCDFKGL